MTNEIRDPSPVCPTCGRYLTVLGCTAERCARPAEDEASVLRDVAELVIGAPVSREQVAVAMRRDDEMRAKALARTWMECQRPGCYHDITTDHEDDGTGRCTRAGCACEAALVRISTVLAAARRQRDK